MGRGVGIETAMFAAYEKEVILPYITQKRKAIARVDDQIEEVPNHLHAILSCDGGMTQLKALQDPESLKMKRKRNIVPTRYDGVIRRSQTIARMK